MIIAPAHEYTSAQVEEAIAASPVIAQQRGLATIDFDFGAL